MYGHILYNYVLVSPGLLRALTSFVFFFFGFCFWKFKNVLETKRQSS